MDGVTWQVNHVYGGHAVAAHLNHNFGLAFDPDTTLLDRLHLPPNSRDDLVTVSRLEPVTHAALIVNTATRIGACWDCKCVERGRIGMLRGVAQL